MPVYINTVGRIRWFVSPNWQQRVAELGCRRRWLAMEACMLHWEIQGRPTAITKNCCIYMWR